VTTMLDWPTPTKESELTPEWLTLALRMSGAISASDTVTGFTAARIGVGTGMMSDLFRIELQYAAGSRPLAAVVAKFSASSAQNRSIAVMMDMYSREVKFYDERASSISEATPRAYYHFYDPATHDMVLLLEDLSDYRPGDQAVGCAVADTELAIKAVAKLHVSTWHAEQREDLASWMRIDGPVYVMGLGGGAAGGFDLAMSRFPDVVPPELLEAAAAYRAAIPALHARMAEGPLALAHGDFRLDNFMFGESAEQKPFVMLDLQAAIVTKPIHDVVYLLTQSVDIDVRRREERRLIELYQRELVELGVSDYSLDQAWEDYRFGALHALEFAILITAALEPGNERGTAWVRQCLGRATQAVVDLDALRLLPDAVSA